MGGLGFNATLWPDGKAGPPEKIPGRCDATGLLRYPVCKLCRTRLEEGTDVYRLVLQYLEVSPVCEVCKNKIWHRP